MGSTYMILAKNRDDKAWLNFQTKSFIIALVILIIRNVTHEIVDISFRNFKNNEKH